MRIGACSHEKEVGALLRGGQWPAGCGAELRAHVAGCGRCSEFVAVRTAMQGLRTGDMAAARLEAPGAIWWRAQLRRRKHWKAAGAKLAGRNALAAFDFECGSLVLTEAGSKRRASLFVLQGEEGLRSIDPGGLEVMTSDLAAFREALSAENRTLKCALTDPRIVSGIGNAYSDEILHAAQMSPIRQTRKLTDEDWERLHTATLSTLQLWIDRMRSEAKNAFPEKVTAFRPEMAVHGRYNLPCPRCGDPVQRIRYADNETNYCASCQTGGKVLADRSLSRLLGSDWPRTLDELEALKRK